MEPYSEDFVWIYDTIFPPLSYCESLHVRFRWKGYHVRQPRQRLEKIDKGQLEVNGTYGGGGNEYSRGDWQGDRCEDQQKPSKMLPSKRLLVVFHSDNTEHVICEERTTRGRNCDIIQAAPCTQDDEHIYLYTAISSWEQKK